MVPWWAMVVAMFFGAFMGVGLVCLVSAGESEAERRWKDE